MQFAAGNWEACALHASWLNTVQSESIQIRAGYTWLLPPSSSAFWPVSTVCASRSPSCDLARSLLLRGGTNALKDHLCEAQQTRSFCFSGEAGFASAEFLSCYCLAGIISALLFEV